jgi:hypothetical protein
MYSVPARLKTQRKYKQLNDNRDILFYCVAFKIDPAGDLTRLIPSIAGGNRTVNLHEAF